MKLPQRIQRKRTRGFRLPPGTICVSRPSKWGNPYRPRQAVDLQLQWALTRYRAWLTGELVAGRLDLAELGSAEYLACWCPLGRPCHVDVLLEVLADAWG